MIRQMPVQEENIVAFRLSGRLTHADYQEFLPRVEQLIEESGRISVLLELVDFHGWDLAAAWDDFRLGMKHAQDFERIAIVGHGTLQRWMALMAKPFTSAQVSFFEEEQIGDAWDWLREPRREARLDAATPTPYRHILVGVDFSAHSVRAVRRALDLAKRHGGRVSLVHPVDAYVYYDQTVDPVAPVDLNLEQELVDAAEDRMSAMLAEFAADGLSGSVLLGSPKRVILSQAEGLHADLIVLGTHGRQGVARLLGSTASGVSHSARCDVLMVRIDGAR